MTSLRNMFYAGQNRLWTVVFNQTNTLIRNNDTRKIIEKKTTPSVSLRYIFKKKIFVKNLTFCNAMTSLCNSMFFAGQNRLWYLTRKTLIRNNDTRKIIENKNSLVIKEKNLS